MAAGKPWYTFYISFDRTYPNCYFRSAEKGYNVQLYQLFTAIQRTKFREIPPYRYSVYLLNDCLVSEQMQRGVAGKLWNARKHSRHSY